MALEVYCMYTMAPSTLELTTNYPADLINRVSNFKKIKKNK